MTAMLIEAYGAEGAIALSENFSLDFLKPLISQTAEMRKSEEEREAELAQETESRFMAKNKHRSVRIVDPDGKSRKINLAQFSIPTLTN